jgi:glutamate formiminotransferase
MNILKPEQLTLREALETVGAEAEIHGVGVSSSEIVGLVPRVCLGEDAARLKLRQEPKILEDLVDRLFAA